MKHLGKVMTLFTTVTTYSRLALDDETRGVFLRRQSIGRELGICCRLVCQPVWGWIRLSTSSRYLKSKPLRRREAEEMIRINRLGACVNRDCTFGGIEAIAHCTGTDGDDGPVRMH